MVLLPAVAAPLLCGSFSPGLQEHYDSKRAILLLHQQPCEEQGGDRPTQKYCKGHANRVLGPLLFLIHIDGIHSTSLSLNSHMTIYADDVCVYSPICSCADFRYVRSDIKAVDEWSAANFQSLNPSKSNYMIIIKEEGSKYSCFTAHASLSYMTGKLITEEIC